MRSACRSVAPTGVRRSQSRRSTTATARVGGRARALPPSAGQPVAKTAKTGAARRPSPLTRDNLGFLLAKASQRWNELLAEGVVAAGLPEEPAWDGSLLLPVDDEAGLGAGRVGRRARVRKQTMTPVVRLLERDGLVERRPDPHDGRAALVFLTRRA